MNQNREFKNCPTHIYSIEFSQRCEDNSMRAIVFHQMVLEQLETCMESHSKKKFDMNQILTHKSQSQKLLEEIFTIVLH